MQRNFDEELVEDREFRIGGELFEFIYPHWTVGAKQMNESFNFVPSENGDEPKQFSWVADTEFAIERIPLYLNPKNDAQKVKALIARKTDAVPRHQLVLLYKWLIEVTNALPTTPPSVPSTGGGDSDTSSSDASSSPEATPTA